MASSASSASDGAKLAGVRRVLASFILSAREMERVDGTAEAGAEAQAGRSKPEGRGDGDDAGWKARLAAAEAAYEESVRARDDALKQARETADALTEARSEGAQLVTARTALDAARREVQRLTDDLAALRAQHAQAQEQAAPQAADDAHPLLGAPVADLGYKTIYAATVGAMLELQQSLPTWHKQRMFRLERAKAIAAYKAKRGQVKPVTLPGIITLVEEADGSMYVLDGQHRIGSLRVLHEKGLADTDEHVMVEVFHPQAPTSAPAAVGDDAPADDVDDAVSSAKDMKRFAELLFKEINQAEPLRDVDWPDTPDNVRLVLEEAVQKLKKTYPKMFSASARCLSPHVNVDVVKDQLFQALFNDGSANEDGLDAATVTVDDIVNFVEKRNAALAKRAESSWTKGLGGKAKEQRLKALAKAKDNAFYLGVVPGTAWLSK